MCAADIFEDANYKQYRPLHYQNALGEIMRNWKGKLFVGLLGYGLASGVAVAVEPVGGQRIGNTYFGSDGSTVQRIGNTDFYGDGRTSQRVGNTRFHSDGLTEQRVGNTRFFSDGTSSQRVGNTEFYSNGQSCQTVGNQVFCN